MFYFFFNLFLAPFWEARFIKLWEIFCSHFLFINCSFKIHLKSKYIFVRNRLTNCISMKKFSKYIFRPKSCCCFIKHWRSCISYPRRAFKCFLYCGEIISRRTSVRFVHNKHNILIRGFKTFPFYQCP